jgi:hypothetical protein
MDSAERIFIVTAMTGLFVLVGMMALLIIAD